MTKTVPPNSELIVIMPVYNEEASVESVVKEWMTELQSYIGHFTLLAIDDGSTDNTAKILRNLQIEYDENLEVISRSNRGHGQTCIQGYRVAMERNIPFILQIDSDGQSDPKHFQTFWDARSDFDVIYGKRRRTDGYKRVLASYILQKALRWFAKVDCVDANVPYRLMNTKASFSAIRMIPSTIDLANIALAVCLKKDPKIRHGCIDIGFPPRRGGEPSVPFRKFASKAMELFGQMKRAGIV